jgi:hypothetical protein
MICVRRLGEKSDIGYCSAQNKDALGYERGQNAKIHKTRKGTKSDRP